MDIKNVTSYVYDADKGTTYTNKKGEKLVLKKGIGFWYYEKGTGKYISTNPHSAPSFRLGEDSLAKLDEKVIGVNGRTLVPHPPNFKTKKARKLWFDENSTRVVNTLMRSAKQVVPTKYKRIALNTKDFVGIRVNLGIEKGDPYIQIGITFQSSFGITVRIQEDNPKAKSILKTKLVKDLVNVYEYVKPKLKLQLDKEKINLGTHMLGHIFYIRSCRIR